MTLADKVVVVTGGASGMGETICPLLAEAGATVIIADRNNVAAQAVAARILEAGGKVDARELDVSQSGQVAEFFSRVVEKWGTIDALVNCAAVTEFLPVEEITESQWRRMIDVDLGGTFYCCREAGKEMIRRKRGKIVNFSSTAGLAGVPYMAHYTAAKHGVVGLTKALAAEWGKYNINVNCICPGATETSMLLESTTEQYRAERAGRTPLNRLAKPLDQAKVVLFLVSEASDYLTGNAICTDGGIYAMAASTSASALHGETFRKGK